jgi:hypothetical protein
MTAGPNIYKFPTKKMPASRPTDNEKRRWEKMRKRKGKDTRLPPGARR